jgi:hypothetical protein
MPRITLILCIVIQTTCEIVSTHFKGKLRKHDKKYLMNYSTLTFIHYSATFGKCANQVLRFCAILQEL